MNLTSDSLEKIIASHTPRVHSDQPGTPAAVLVPLVESAGRFDLLLTKRTDTVEHHKSQISFPGGRVDESDRSLEATALRESWEEVGLPSDAVRVLGALDQVWTPSGFLITPIVGLIAPPLPALVPSPSEVEEIMLIPLEKFMDESNFHTELRVVQGVERTVYFFHVAAEPVWGATALIIHGLITLIRNNG
jgi:8-oxo-dGTP pyrophosphatase MutT (NUDIX family)